MKPISKRWSFFTHCIIPGYARWSIYCEAQRNHLLLQHTLIIYYWLHTLRIMRVNIIFSLNPAHTLFFFFSQIPIELYRFTNMILFMLIIIYCCCFFFFFGKISRPGGGGGPLPEKTKKKKKKDSNNHKPIIFLQQKVL